MASKKTTLGPLLFGLGLLIVGGFIASSWMVLGGERVVTGRVVEIEARNGSYYPVLEYSDPDSGIRRTFRSSVGNSRRTRAPDVGESFEVVVAADGSAALRSSGSMAFIILAMGATFVGIGVSNMGKSRRDNDHEYEDEAAYHDG